MITNPDAQRILVFGDSLSWGYMPDSDHERWPANIRWPGRLQLLLGDGYEVIEEALNSRAIDNIDRRSGKEGRRALDYVEGCLDSHDPLDYAIVLLGSNELKHEYNNTAEAVGQQMRGLLDTIMTRPSQFRDKKPEVILLAPPVVDETKEYCTQNDKYLGATEKSRELGVVYAGIAEELGLRFLNLADIVVTGADGCHLDAESHAKVADVISGFFANTGVWLKESSR